MRLDEMANCLNSLKSLYAKLVNAKADTSFIERWTGGNEAIATAVDLAGQQIAILSGADDVDKYGNLYNAAADDIPGAFDEWTSLAEACGGNMSQALGYETKWTTSNFFVKVVENAGDEFHKTGEELASTANYSLTMVAVIAVAVVVILVIK